MAWRGIDLRDLHRPNGGPSRLTWRRLRTLIEGLPPESATWTAIRNATPVDELADLAEESEPEKAPWSRQEMLTAQLVDAVNNGTYILKLAHSDKGAQVKPPVPVRRPGWRPPADQKQPPTAAAMAYLDAMLAASA